MKVKIAMFFVLIIAVVNGTKNFLLSADPPAIAALSDLPTSTHAFSPKPMNINPPIVIIDNPNLVQGNIAERQGFIDGAKSQEDLEFEAWVQLMSLSKEMRLRSGGGSSVFTVDEFALVSEWKERTGQFSVDELLVKAVAISIDAIRGNPDSPLRPSLNYLRKEAVIAGSTHELYELGAQYSLNAREAKARGDEKAYRQEIVEALAYSLMRTVCGVGDAIMTISATIQNHEIKDDHEFLDKAEQRGRELYGRFSDLRREKGWGEFDNSVPAPVKRMHANNICKNEKACVNKILNN